MDLQVIVILVFLAAGVKGRTAVDSLPQGPDSQYLFSYGVNDEKTGSNFAHQETKDGLATKGQYRVALPDGRTQVVTYTADENGYNAVVSYEGVAVHPDDEDPVDHPPIRPPKRTRVRKIRPGRPTLPPQVIPLPSPGSDLPLFSDQGVGLTSLPDHGPDFPLFPHPGPVLSLLPGQGQDLPLFPDQGPNLAFSPNQENGPPLFSDPQNFPLGFPHVPAELFDQDPFVVRQDGPPLRRSKPVTPKPTLVPTQPTPNFPPGFSFHSPFPPDISGNSFPLNGAPHFPVHFPPFQSQFDPTLQQIPNFNEHLGFFPQFPILEFNDPQAQFSPVSNGIFPDQVNPQNIFVDIPRINSQVPAGAGLTQQPDLSLFIPEQDLHDPNLPNLISNAVQFHPIPVSHRDQNIPDHIIEDSPVVTPLPPPSPPPPVPHHFTTIRHHGSPTPHHIPSITHHVSPIPLPVTPQQNAFISHHTRPKPPHKTFHDGPVPFHGTSFAHHISAPHHHDDKLHPVSELPFTGAPIAHFGIPAPIQGAIIPHHGTPLPPPSTRVPHIGTSLFHDDSHHGSPVPLFVTPIPFHGIPPPHHGIPRPTHGLSGSRHSTPVPPHGASISKQGTPVPLSGPPLPLPSSTPLPGSPVPPHGTPAPLQDPHLFSPGHPVFFPGSPIPFPGSPVPFHSTFINLSGFPVPEHGTPVPFHDTPFPGHGSPLPGHGTPVPLHRSSSSTHGTPIPIRGSPVPLIGPPVHRHDSPVPSHGIPVSHIITPLPQHRTPSPIHEIPAPQLETLRPHHESHFESPFTPDIIPTTFRPARIRTGGPPRIPIPHHTSPVPQRITDVTHHESSFHPSSLHPVPFVPNGSVFLSGPLDHQVTPNPFQAISKPLPPPVHSIGSATRRSNIGKSIAPFLPGAPGLDREQVLRHKKLSKSPRFSRSVSEFPKSERNRNSH